MSEAAFLFIVIATVCCITCLLFCTCVIICS